jgi:hypothetical protein
MIVRAAAQRAMQASESSFFTAHSEKNIGQIAALLPGAAGFRNVRGEPVHDRLSTGARILRQVGRARCRVELGAESEETLEHLDVAARERVSYRPIAPRANVGAGAD